MRLNTLTHFSRIACVLSSLLSLVAVPIGCGGDSSSNTATVGQLPPEATQANKSMEDFMKTKDAAKKK